MGMDVYGKNPIDGRGEYFRNSAWSWRPLAYWITDHAPAEITSACQYWQSNDGDGLDTAGSIALADWIDQQVASGEVAKFESNYKETLARLPDEECKICEGTGKRMSAPKVGAGDITCNACSGNGKRPHWKRSYPFSLENVTQFSAFCRSSGGFEIF